jgi:hypothetical protein
MPISTGIYFKMKVVARMAHICPNIKAGGQVRSATMGMALSGQGDFLIHLMGRSPKM